MMNAAIGRPGGFGPGGPGGANPRQAGMEAAADALGMETSEMRARLGDGATLADLAAESGVATDDLKASMLEAISEVAPPQAAGMISDRLDAVIAGDATDGPGPFGGGGDRRAAAAERVADALGMTPEELRDAAMSGELRSMVQGAESSLLQGLLVDEEA